MKKIILCLSLLLFFLSFANLQAQEASLSENEKYQIDKIYPNPVQGQVFVELYSENFTSVQFELIDILGNKIKLWKKRELVPGNQKVSLDLQSIHPGFYLLKTTIGGQVIVKRIRKV
jgi:hypothetical protein